METGIGIRIGMPNNGEKTMNYFTIIPWEIENDDRLTHGAKYLYGKIKALSEKEGFCWATNKYLAKITKASVSSIKRWKNILANIGYIKSEIIYKGETKEVVGRKLALSDMNRIETNLNRGVGSNFRVNNINNNNIDYKDLERKKAYARACENNELNKKEQELKNEIERLKKQLEELKPQVSNETKIEKESKFVDVSNSQLMGEYQAEKESEDIDTPDLTSEYSDIFDFELKNKYSCEEIKKTQQDNYTESVNNDSMSTYGRESFDDITSRKISYTEERVKLGKYLAFIICRFGKITNDVWEAFLDRYLSLGNTVKERLANLSYSFAGGYRNIFKVSKHENTQTQYSAISIFD